MCVVEAGWRSGLGRRFQCGDQVQIPLWPLAGVVLGKCLVQLLGDPCK